jgi:hypothetical protein
MQIRHYECVSSARACPAVLSLMYPSRTREPLSVLKHTTDPDCWSRHVLVITGGAYLPSRESSRLGDHSVSRGMGVSTRSILRSGMNHASETAT